MENNTVHLSSRLCSSIISKGIFKQMCLHHYKKRRYKRGKGEKGCDKEQSNLLCSGCLQLSNGLEEPTSCSWAKAYSLAQPAPSWTINLTGEAKADKIVYQQKCHKFYSKPYENIWLWEAVKKQDCCKCSSTLSSLKY